MIIVTAKNGNNTVTINGGGQHIKGSIAQEAGAIHSFTFTIYPNNPGYDLINSRKTIIRAVNDVTGRTEFAGRVLLPTEKMDGSGMITKSVTCESFLGYLYDSVQPYAEVETYTLNDYIDMVLANHNAQVEAEKQITRGTVNVPTTEQGHVTKGLQYQTTFETLKTKLVDVFGGELEVVEVNGALKLNYVTEIGTTRTTRIEIGRNMQTAERQVSPLSLITRVIPLGAKLKVTETDADGNDVEVETEERLTLVGYEPEPGEPMTVPYLDDQAKIDAVGIVCGVLDLPDVTEQSNLYAKALSFMQNDNRLELSHNITALDLKEIGLDIDGFYCGDTYPVYNNRIGIDEPLRIIRRSIDINAPHKGSLTFGVKRTTLSGYHAAQNSQTEKRFEEVTQQIAESNRVVQETATRVETFGATMQDTVEAAITDRFATVATKTELEELETRTNYRTAETAQGLMQEFGTQINTRRTDAAGNLESKFEELKAYIRYYMENGQPIIELGQRTSDLVAKISNSEIGFYENDMKVAYISNNQLYITNATVLTRLHIGNFAFVPRQNGNLSFVKVG